MHIESLTAAHMVAAFARKDISPVEVLQAVCARVEVHDREICATYAFDPAGAMAAARQSEARWLAGTPAGPLDGVPVTLKENIATRGVPVPLGTAASDMTPALEDAPPAARLREGGAVIFAKTTMPDYGMLSSGLSSFHPLTRNPWDRTRNPGGSSAGAAASAAAGFGPIHVGTDIGGSIRLPAGWCGVFGFKPSLGRIAIDPPYVGRCAGPLTRTVEDAALAVAVMARPDGRDHMGLPAADIDWSIEPAVLKGLRIGLMPYAGCGIAPEPEILAAVHAAADMFARAGAIVEEIEPILTREMLDGVDRFWRARAFADVARLPPDRREKILPFIRQWAESGEDLSGQEVFHGFSQIMAMRSEAHRASLDHDFIISPVAAMPAFDVNLPGPTNDPERPFEHIAFTVAFNMSEQPAASINCGYTTDGLPIGLQIAGRRFDDRGVLGLARAWEQIRPAQRPWPV